MSVHLRLDLFGVVPVENLELAEDGDARDATDGGEDEDKGNQDGVPGVVGVHHRRLKHERTVITANVCCCSGI